MNSEKEGEVPRQRIFTENSKTTVPKPLWYERIYQYTFLVGCCEPFFLANPTALIAASRS